jgi:hypothetical protein
LGGASAGNQAGAAEGDVAMARVAKTKTKSANSENSQQNPVHKSSVREGNKTSAITALLKSKLGATIPELMEATGWQAHSVRGFLAGSLRQRHGLQLVSEKRDGELRRYRAR